MANVANTVSKDPQEDQTMYYVTIPERTILGDRHPGVRINNKEWLSGTHLVEKKYADEITAILNRYNEGQVRLLQNRVDIEALKQLLRGSSSASAGVAFDASQVTSDQLPSMGAKARLIS